MLITNILSGINQPNVKIIWFNTSDNGIITHLDLSQFTQKSRQSKLEELANLGTLGAIVHKSDSIYAAMHPDYVEQFQQIYSIDGKKIEVAALNGENFRQIINATINEEVNLEELDEENEKVIGLAPAEKQQSSLRGSRFVSLVEFQVQETFHDCIMKMFENAQKTQDEMRELQKQKDKEKDEKKAEEKAQLLKTHISKDVLDRTSSDTQYLSDSNSSCQILFI